MGKKLFLYLYLLVGLSYGQSDTKRALFLGNSYTYSNNLPSLISSMAASTGDILEHSSNAIGGYTLQQHTTNTVTNTMIAQGNWDFVVLQEQSQMPSFSIEFVEEEVYPYAKKLDSIIKLNKDCVETVFFMTWGRKNGDQSNCPNYPPVCTYEGMDDLLKERYLEMASQNEAVVSPVGAVWRYIREQHPEIELYIPDESHPSLAGSYAAACCFYTVFFQKDPLNISYNSTLSSETAQLIKTAVHHIVYNHFDSWSIGLNNPTSNFSYSNTGPYQYQFSNLSDNSDSYFWDFGDGSTSSETNPIHTYNGPGNYTISLVAENCYHYNMTTETINQALNVVEANSKFIRTYPNPCDKMIFIESENPLLKKELYSVDGKLIKKAVSGENTIDTSEIKEGVYLLKLTDTSDNIKNIRIIVKH